jgi:stage II sporulation protein D
LQRLLALTVALSALAFSSAASAAPVFFIWGKGWGHGIGMPQWGAYGYALHGRDYTWILDHYYRGTKRGTASKTTIRVLLAAGRSSVTISSSRPWTIRDGRGRSWDLAAGGRTIGTDLRVRAEGKKRRLAPPVTLRGGGPLSVNGAPYRRSIVLRKRHGALAVVNVLGLQPYLKGVVPEEMPSSWHPEALKVQAVAARSYALASVRTGTYYDVEDGTNDQVYNGVAAEEPSTNAAVEATRNEIRTYGGRVATTYFSSSSGGRTTASEDAWGGEAIPYLRSVYDRWDRISPHHRWGPIRYSRAALDARLGGYVHGTLKDVVVHVNPSRRVERMVMDGTGGSSSLPGWDVRTVLGLKSAWFRVGVLNIVAGRDRIESGQRVTLRGKARSVGSAWLERRAPGGEWAKLRELELSDKARFVTTVAPRATRLYRVSSAKGSSGGVKVRVTAAVRFARPADRSGLAGIVLPAGEGTTVAVQRRSGGTWRTVATGSTDAMGRFAVAFPLLDATYRAVAGGGVSPLLRVVG